MKYLLLILMVACCGCTSHVHEVDSENLKFLAGDEVKITAGFYVKCTGIIESYNQFRLDNKPVIYEVRVICPNTLNYSGTIVGIKENILKPVKD